MRNLVEQDADTRHKIHLDESHPTLCVKITTDDVTKSLLRVHY
jgi:hypothetical protein